MKDKKTEFRYFTISEYEKEQEYLQNQHRKGWKLVRIGLVGFYHFEKCEPEDVVYQLDYNQEGIAHKEEYIQMFRDCGWEYLLDFVGYSYFYKPVSEMKEDEKIFCDDNSRLDMLERVFKGKMIPLLTIFSCMILPQLFLQYHIDKRLFGVFIVLFILYLLIFLQYGFQYWKLKRKER